MDTTQTIYTALHCTLNRKHFIWLLNFIWFCCLYTGCDWRLSSQAAAADTGREVGRVAASAHRALQVAELRARAGLVADGGVVLRAEAGRHAGLRGHAHHALHLLAVPPPLLLGQPAQWHDTEERGSGWCHLPGSLLLALLHWARWQSSWRPHSLCTRLEQSAARAGAGPSSAARRASSSSGHGDMAADWHQSSAQWAAPGWHRWRTD